MCNLTSTVEQGLSSLVTTMMAEELAFSSLPVTQELRNRMTGEDIRTHEVGSYLRGLFITGKMREGYICVPRRSRNPLNEVYMEYVFAPEMVDEKMFTEDVQPAFCWYNPRTWM